VNTVLHEFLLDVPRAATIWVVLVAPALLAFGGAALTGPRGRRRPGRSRRLGRWRPGGSRRAARLDLIAEELSRYASEVAVAADRAEETARRARAAWLSTQDDVEAAWCAFEGADREARRLARTAGLPVPRTPHTTDEYVDRERYLHRAAMVACAHSELSAVDLSSVLAHRDGWDPRYHPVEQETRLRQAIADGLRAAERRAAERERVAWQAAETAAAAASSLRAEALAAAERVAALRPQALRGALRAPAPHVAVAVPEAVAPAANAAAATTVAFPAAAATTVAFPAAAATTVAFPAAAATTVALPAVAAPTVVLPAAVIRAPRAPAPRPRVGVARPGYAGGMPHR